jgi:hypothetical protein
MHNPAELRPHAPVRPSQKRTSPLPAASASLCVLSASALDFLSPRCWLPALSLPNGPALSLAERVDFHLSATSSPLTPLLPPLARPTLNHPVVYKLQTIGGGVVQPIDQTTHKPLGSTRSNHMLQGMAPYDFLPVTNHQSPATLLAPLRSSPLGAKITLLLDLETFGRPMVSNTKSGQRLGHTVRRRAQPRSASRPQFLLRRWGRKADRVRLGQRTLVG